MQGTPASVKMRAEHWDVAGSCWQAASLPVIGQPRLHTGNDTACCHQPPKVQVVNIRTAANTHHLSGAGKAVAYCSQQNLMDFLYDV